MPSVALQEWHAGRATALDEIESAHRAVGGTAPGRRYATQQINQAYAVLVSSQFQAFCRDLHTECIDHLVTALASEVYRPVLIEEFMLHRKLDRGNPNPGNLGADFDRLGVRFWLEVAAVDSRNPQRRQLLGELNEWRNAIAHQDFVGLSRAGGRPVLHLSRVQIWRKACAGLAGSFDSALGLFIRRMTGTAPW